MLLQLFTQKVIGGLAVLFALSLTISNVSEQFGGSAPNDYAQLGSGGGSGGETCSDWSSATIAPSSAKSAGQISVQGAGDDLCSALIAQIVGEIPGGLVSCKCKSSPDIGACGRSCTGSDYPSVLGSHRESWDALHPTRVINNSGIMNPCPRGTSCNHSENMTIECCLGKVAFGKCCGIKKSYTKEACGVSANFCLPAESPSPSPSTSPTPDGSGGSGPDSTGSGGSGGSGSGPDSTGSGSGHSYNRGELNRYYASLNRINRFMD